MFELVALAPRSQLPAGGAADSVAVGVVGKDMPFKEYTEVPHSLDCIAGFRTGVAEGATRSLDHASPLTPYP